MSDLKSQLSRLVYSTDKGRVCPDCGAADSECRCQTLSAEHVWGDGRVRVSRQTKGRKGKAVTLVEGLAMTSAELEQTAKRLKTRCGSGGAVKDGVIEIQGDQRQTVVAWLHEQGITAKLAGG